MDYSFCSSYEEYLDPIMPIVAIFSLFSGLVLGNHGPSVQLEAAQNELRQTQAVVRDLEQKLEKSEQENATLRTRMSELEVKLASAEASRNMLSQTLREAQSSLGTQTTQKNTAVKNAQDLELWYRNALIDIGRLTAELDKRDVLVKLGMVNNRKLLAAQAAIQKLEAQVKKLASNEKNLADLLEKSLSLQTESNMRRAELENELRTTNGKLADAKKLIQLSSYVLLACVLCLAVLSVILIVSLILSARRKPASAAKTN